MNEQKKKWEAQYEQLKKSLGEVGWISEGSVQDRGPGKGGAHYLWSRKVKAKTVSVALSKEQYEWMRESIENWKAMQETLRKMRILSRRMVFKTLPNPKRRKRLNNQVLGLN